MRSGRLGRIGEGTLNPISEKKVKLRSERLVKAGGRSSEEDKGRVLLGNLRGRRKRNIREDFGRKNFIRSSDDVEHW